MNVNRHTYYVAKPSDNEISDWTEYIFPTADGISDEQIDERIRIVLLGADESLLPFADAIQQSTEFLLAGIIIPEKQPSLIHSVISGYAAYRGIPCFIGKMNSTVLLQDLLVSWKPKQLFCIQTGTLPNELSDYNCTVITDTIQMGDIHTASEILKKMTRG